MLIILIMLLLLSIMKIINTDNDVWRFITGMFVVVVFVGFFFVCVCGGVRP